MIEKSAIISPQNGIRIQKCIDFPEKSGHQMSKNLYMSKNSCYFLAFEVLSFPHSLWLKMFSAIVLVISVSKYLIGFYTWSIVFQKNNTEYQQLIQNSKSSSKQDNFWVKLVKEIICWGFYYFTKKKTILISAWEICWYIGVVAYPKRSQIIKKITKWSGINWRLKLKLTSIQVLNREWESSSKESAKNKLQEDFAWTIKFVDSMGILQNVCNWTIGSLTFDSLQE